MELFRQADKEHNLTALDALLSEDYLLVTRTGQTNTKKEFLDRVRRDAIPQMGTSENIRTQIHGNTGVVTEKASVSTQQGMRDTVQTSVWVKDADRWKLVLRQVTPVP
jgi:hypothetical protein